MKIQKEGFLALVKSARTRILAAILLTLVCAGTVAAAALSSYEVKIIDGKDSKLVHTSETDASVIVKNKGYELKEKDELEISFPTTLSFQALNMVTNVTGRVESSSRVRSKRALEK